MTTDTELVTPPRERLAVSGLLLALCVVLGPLGMAASVLSVPYTFSDDPAEWIPKVADAGAQTEASFWGLLVWGVFAPVGAIVTGLVARRGALRVGTTGMVLAFLGAGAFAVMGWGYDGIALAASNAGLGTADVESLMSEVDGLQAPFAAGLLIPLMFIGVILLGIALWRGRDVPRWAALALMVTPPLVLVGGVFAMPVNAAGFVVMAAGFGAAGLAFVRGVRGPRAGTRARQALAVTGTLAPAFMGVWALSVPGAITDSHADGLPKLAAAEGRVELSLWMLFAFALTSLVAAIVTGLVARRGSQRTAMVGMGMAVLGFGALNVAGLTWLGAALASIRAGNSDEVTEKILQELDEFSVGLGAAIFVPLMFIGVVLLGIALWRGRTVPRWSAAMLLMAFPVIAAGGLVSMQVNALGWFMMTVAFGVVGVAYVRQADEPSDPHPARP